MIASSFEVPNYNGGTLLMTSQWTTEICIAVNGNFSVSSKMCPDIVNVSFFGSITRRYIGSYMLVPSNRKNMVNSAL